MVNLEKSKILTFGKNVPLHQTNNMEPCFFDTKKVEFSTKKKT